RAKLLAYIFPFPILNEGELFARVSRADMDKNQHPNEEHELHTSLRYLEIAKVESLSIPNAHKDGVNNDLGS
ncbi:MAG: hypothetical protein KGQ60_17560, partial [Planctomycetes bacterium]|nr:hypothetical protein [Planctomycetota bacterium]